MTILLIHFLTTMSFVINEIICTFSFLARLELLAIKKAMLNLSGFQKYVYTNATTVCKYIFNHVQLLYMAKVYDVIGCHLLCQNYFNDVL